MAKNPLVGLSRRLRPGLIGLDRRISRDHRIRRGCCCTLGAVLSVAVLWAGPTTAGADQGVAFAFGSNEQGQLGVGDTWSPKPSLISNGLRIAAGGRHGLAVKTDGTVWAWGRNDKGQLGDGTTADRPTPVQVLGLTDVVAVAGGFGHSLALKADGTIWAWGDNGRGQLGDGTTTQRWTPVQVSGLTGVTAIAAGYSHSLARKADGTVWAWGNDTYGQLGNGTPGSSLTPVQVSFLPGTEVTAIAAGSYHSLAVARAPDGTVGVWAWGNNGFGQLGNGTTTGRSTPVRALGLTGATAVAAGYSHSLALKNDGTVWAWGRNDKGQLGVGPTPASQSTPVKVPGLTDVTAIGAGHYHSLARLIDGSARAWGRNDQGQLGDGTTTQRSTPVPVQSLNGAVSLAGGELHSLALKADGTVWGWGYNMYGQLGNGATRDRTTPAQGISGVAALAGGSSHSLLLKADGTVWACGSNEKGQLGVPTPTVESPTPIQVQGLSGVAAVAAGYYHSLARKTDGTVWAWGDNQYGQLGDGTTTPRLTPVRVMDLDGVAAVAGGYYHSLARKTDGTVWAWGGNQDGQLGDGTTTGRTTPVRVLNLDNIIAIAAGNTHSLALRADGTVWAWGRNDSGQLGDGTNTQRSEPVQVQDLDRVAVIAAGYSHSLARKTDGTVWAWGDNLFGQLGDGTRTQRCTPVQVQGLDRAAAIAGGESHSLVLKVDGTVWAWGNNEDGRLGDGTTTQRSTPVQTQGLDRPIAVAAGGYHSLVIQPRGIWYLDHDGDGYGDAGAPQEAFSRPDGHVADATDCDDTRADVHPGATEICGNGLDDDCVGGDGPCPTPWYRDADADGYGDPAATLLSVGRPAGYVADNDDCDDNDPTTHPGAPEPCDGVDHNCDGHIPLERTWYRDADGDGYGDAADISRECTQPAGYVADNTDCHDGDNTVWPGALELCDAKDNDCDGQVDENIPTWYRDADADGFGDPRDSVEDCIRPAGYVFDATDCDDTRAGVHPGATEICGNGLDDDCAGGDAPCPTTWYRDADGDGYGNPQITTQAVTGPPGYVADATDCDDTRTDVHPEATESCNDLDDNCDGRIDEGCLTIRIAGPGLIRSVPGSDAESPTFFRHGEPRAFPAGTRLVLRAEPQEDCDLFAGWSGAVSSTSPTIEVVLTDRTVLEAGFVDRAWVPALCGGGVCQAAGLSLLGLALMRRRSGWSA